MVHVGRKELTQERKKILREVLPKIRQQGTLSGHPEMGAGRCPLEKQGEGSGYGASYGGSFVREKMWQFSLVVSRSTKSEGRSSAGSSRTER